MAREQQKASPSFPVTTTITREELDHKCEVGS